MRDLQATIRKAIYSAVPAVVFGLAPMCSSADWTNAGGISKDEPQDVVVSLKANPLTNPEAACLTVTLARATLYSSGIQVELDDEGNPILDDDGDPIPILHEDGFPIPVANVTIFPTLDGVALGVEKIVSNPKFKCDVPLAFPPNDDDGVISLEENLRWFLAPFDGETLRDENLLICPLCWSNRYGSELPDYGLLPGANAPGNAIGDLLLNADKFIDIN